MLPTTLGANAAQAGRSRASKAHGYFSTYFRRIVKPRQMDFEWVPCISTALRYVAGTSRCVVMHPPSTSLLQVILAIITVCCLCRRYTFWLMLQLCISPKTA